MTVCDWNCVSKELKLDTIHIKKNRILNSDKHYLRVLLKLADKYVGVFFTIYRKVNKKQYKEK